VDDIGADRGVKDTIVEQSCSLVFFLEIDDGNLDREVLGSRIDTIWGQDQEQKQQKTRKKEDKREKRIKEEEGRIKDQGSRKKRGGSRKKRDLRGG